MGTKNDTESKSTNFSYESNITTINNTYASSYQILNGLNQTNLPVINKAIYINSPAQDYYVNFTGYEYDKLIYHVYFTTQNYFTYYPIIADNESVAVIEMKTLKRRS